MKKIWIIIIILAAAVLAWFLREKWLGGGLEPLGNDEQKVSEETVDVSDFNQGLEGITIDEIDQQFQSIDEELKGL